MKQWTAHLLSWRKRSTQLLYIQWMAHYRTCWDEEKVQKITVYSMNGSLVELKKKVRTVIYIQWMAHYLLRWRKRSTHLYTKNGSLAEMKKKVHTVLYKEWLTCWDEEKGPHSYIQRMAHLLRWRKRSTQLWTMNGSLAVTKKKVHTAIYNEWLTCWDKEKDPHSYCIYKEWIERGWGVGEFGGFREENWWVEWEIFLVFCRDFTL